MLRPIASIIALFALCWLVAGSAGAQTVDISIPSMVSFDVTDVTTDTSSPDPFTITFSNCTLNAGNSLKISVHSNTAHFSSVGGDALPASLLKWTVTAASGGTGSPGTLSTSDSVVFQSTPDPTSGSTDLAWTLSAPGASGVKAGNHNLTMTWKIEAV